MKTPPTSAKYARATRGPLVPCPRCARHVFAAVEGTCPFCSSTLPHELLDAAPRATTERLSRAQTFSFNAVGRRELSLGDLSAVAGGVRPDNLGVTNPELGGAPNDAGSSFSMYGAPIPAGGAFDPGSLDAGGSFAMYGAPALQDPFEPGWGGSGSQNDTQAQGGDAYQGSPGGNEVSGDSYGDNAGDPYAGNLGAAGDQAADQGGDDFGSSGDPSE